MSYIIVKKGTLEPVCELFNKSNVERINTTKYEALPIKDYLYKLNAKIKEN